MEYVILFLIDTSVTPDTNRNIISSKATTDVSSIALPVVAVVIAVVLVIVAVLVYAMRRNNHRATGIQSNKHQTLLIVNVLSCAFIAMVKYVIFE